jgi:hypothetical protein
MTTTRIDTEVVYSRTTIMADGSQQIEQFMPGHVQRAFIDGILGDPSIINLISADQAATAREAMGTYAQVVND